jgi:hypothetical protein
LVGKGRHKIGSLPPRASLPLKLVRNPNAKRKLNKQETVRELKKDTSRGRFQFEQADQIVAEQREIQQIPSSPPFSKKALASVKAGCK